MVPRLFILVYVGFLVHAFVVIKILPILVIRKTSLKITKQEAGPATATSTTRHMNNPLLHPKRGETSTVQAMTFTAQDESATAKVSLRISGELAVQRGRGDSSSSSSVIMNSLLSQFLFKLLLKLSITDHVALICVHCY